MATLATITDAMLRINKDWRKIEKKNSSKTERKEAGLGEQNKQERANARRGLWRLRTSSGHRRPRRGSGGRRAPSPAPWAPPPSRPRPRPRRRRPSPPAPGSLAWVRRQSGLTSRRGEIEAGEGIAERTRVLRGKFLRFFSPLVLTLEEEEAPSPRVLRASSRPSSMNGGTVQIYAREP